MSNMYRKKFSPSYLRRLKLRFASYYVPHFILRHYRRTVPAIAYTRPNLSWEQRRRNARYDAMYNILLDGYCELLQTTLSAATGQMLFFLRELSSSFDEEFERCVEENLPLDLKDILGSDRVQIHLHHFKAYLRLYGRADSVLAHMHDVFDRYFQEYVSVFNSSPKHLSFGELRDGAQIDSGIQLRTMFEAVALFNGHQVSQAIQSDYYELGMAGKYADDMVDLVRDISKKRPNMLYAILRENPSEYTAFEQALSTSVQMNAVWWENNCPQTYGYYFQQIEPHYEKIVSSKLRLACDLMMLATVIGYDYDPDR